MQPLLFGDPKSPLYGVYHPALARQAAPLAVVLCPPLGHEYMRTHRALRQLASALAKQGHHVLRFDYRGTGDSAGDAANMHLRDWVQDVADAALELTDTAGIRQTALVGLRTGALVASLAAAEAVDGLQRLICWDPVTDGQGYLDELRAMADAPWESGDVIGGGGLAFSAALRAELAAVRLDQVKPAAGTEVLVIGSELRDAYTALADAWRTAGVAARAEVVESPGNWDDLDRIGAQLLPQAIIRAIAAEFASIRERVHA